ncbi:MAG TPA: DPP IV N-terminal domain-containing protein [Gemmatimonadales bacterium]|nr:DPP IV N-terminal domain-containing protein [Gemmatimonadales bacterium]
MTPMRRGGVGLLLVVAACGGGGGEKAPAVPTARLLSPEGVNHLQSSFSPDGSHVAWWMPGEDGWDVMVAKSDLSGARIAAGHNLQTWNLYWSPDSRQVATGLSEVNVTDLAIIPVDSGVPRLLTNTAAFEVPSSWSSRGDRLTYTVTSEGGALRGAIMNPATGASTPLPASANATPIARWSPDGKQLTLEALNGDAGIWIGDSTGGNARQLTTERQETDARWSPDGTEIAYVSRRTGTGDIWVVPAAGGTPRQLTHDIREDNSPRWSPDGKWIAFLSQRGRQGDIWIVPAAGGTELRVTDDAAEEGNLQWVGTSNTIAYHTGISGQTLWALTVNDGKERRLTADSLRVGQIFPSPDGKEVAYEVLRGGGVSDIQVMPIAGGAARTLVAGTSINTAINWSPDGKTIAFLSNRTGNFDVWVIPAAGGEPRELTTWPSNEGGNTAPQWAPDGSQIYFLSPHDASPFNDVWKVPLAGGEPVRVTKSGTLNNLAVSLVSPDVFVQSVGGKGGTTVLAKVLPDGKLQTLWDKSNVSGLSWLSFTPKGDSLGITVQLPGGGLGSYLISTRTGEGRQMLGKNDQIGDFSPDGNWVAYWSGNPSLEMNVLNMKDGSTKRLTNSPESETTYWWVSDNNTIVFLRASQHRRIAEVDLTRLLAGAK